MGDNRKTETARQNRWESLKRVIVLQLSLVGLLLQTGVYAYFWFTAYYPDAVRLKLKFYFNGHALILLIYFFLLLFFSNTYGGTKIGYLKPLDVILSQAFSLLAVNVISYFQISLMRNWLVEIGPMVWTMALQVLLSILWVNLSDAIYKKVFPPRQMLLVHGERPIEDILNKFASRPDKYRIADCVNIAEGEEKVREQIDSGRFGAVVLWDIPTPQRNHLMKYCFGISMRTYVMPKIPDVLTKGSSQLHLFDTPLYLTREYALTFEQRFWKRAIDIVCALLLLILSSPITIVTAIAIKAYDGGPVFYKQIRCTLGQKEFGIIKFRSMKVDAEKDGVARLAAKNDSRITPIGRFIRAVRIDELPQLINILKGEMSFIGPRPERPQIIAQYMEEMPEFGYRTKVKAGLAGYAQVYGKYNTTPYDKLKLDLTYIQNYSVWLDLKLMLLTLKILIQPESTEGVEQNQVTAMKRAKEEEK
ncbi:MAG: exopolysaccharide biosynthesis polyprenyl glycosylphosphotransferase [Eubacteriales bacterium]|nr:exopolysaccharide biosynthesis polyprenyl glycosylphosphotransferase [Eubacteriales bacterium]